MPADPVDSAREADPAAGIGSAQIGFAMERLRSQQNMPAALGAGLVSSALGAGVWAGITVVTGSQIGWIAVGVGFLVGHAVRIAAKGIDAVYGVIGGAFALLGCVAGNSLAVCQLVADQEGMAFLDEVVQLDLALIRELMVATFSPMDLLFYGIALYEGHKLSFRQPGAAEWNALLPGQAPAA